MCWVYIKKTVCQDCKDPANGVWGVDRDFAMCDHAARVTKTHGDCPTGSVDVEALIGTALCGVCANKRRLAAWIAQQKGGGGS